MDEILKKLLESELLNEETKSEIATSFQTLTTQLREDITTEVRVQLTEEFVKAQAELVEAIDSKLNEQVKAEIDELKEDIDSFRDLEVEYAEKLVEEKERMAGLLGEQIDELVDKVDAFLDKQVSAEVTELSEDIKEVQKLEFGRKIFEAMEAEFRSFRKVDTLKIEQDLAEAKDKLSDATKLLEQNERQRSTEARATKLESLLEGVEGIAKEQLKVILSNISTDKLDEAFKIYAPRVLKESLESKTKEEIIAEATVTKVETTVITGEEVIKEAKVVTVKSDPALERLKKLAGLAG